MLNTQLSIPIANINRRQESPTLKKFKSTRTEFRFLVDMVLDDCDDEDTLYTEIVDHFSIPVRERGKYPSDASFDSGLTTEQIEIYTMQYHYAVEFLKPKWRNKDLYQYDMHEYFARLLSSLEDAPYYVMDGKVV